MAVPKYGLSKEQILKLVNKGIPVCIWSSIGNSEIKYIGGWYLIKDGEYSDELFYWPSGEHCLVITGHDAKNVKVCDPLKGVCEYPKESFFRGVYGRLFVALYPADGAALRPR